MKIDRPVFLLGFMGSGKTYWGANMSEKTGIPFYDLDALIEAKTSNSIKGIFTASGETGFRIIEQQTLHECQKFGACFIATGGGTPCFFDNMLWMNNIGLTIYLKVPIAILVERLKHDSASRPILANVGVHDLEKHIEKIMQHRAPYYDQANTILEYNGDDTAFAERLLTAVGFGT